MGCPPQTEPGWYPAHRMPKEATMRALLERETAGLAVSVEYDDELTKDTILVCERADGGIAVATVPPDRVMDAFDHPACYLAPEHRRLLDPRTVVEDDEVV